MLHPSSNPQTLEYLTPDAQPDDACRTGSRNPQTLATRLRPTTARATCSLRDALASALSRGRRRTDCDPSVGAVAGCVASAVTADSRRRCPARGIGEIESFATLAGKGHNSHQRNQQGNTALVGWWNDVAHQCVRSVDQAVCIGWIAAD